MVLLAAILLTACGGKPPAHEVSDVPMRVVSLDYCADQYVLKMVDPARILAVSVDATKPFSYMREAASGVTQVQPSAENILALKPDLIVRSYGGGPNATAFFEQAGLPVLQVGWVNDMDGVKRVTRDMAHGLGADDLGEEMVADIEARLLALHTKGEQPAAFYMTPGGVTSGPGSLVHEMLVEAGLSNFMDAPGWHDLPLEALARTQPDMVAFASFNSHKTPWSSARHPIARLQVRDLPTARIEGAWTACGAWYLVDAIEALSEAKP